MEAHDTNPDFGEKPKGMRAFQSDHERRFALPRNAREMSSMRFSDYMDWD